MVLIFGELLKFLLVERLFRLSREKLMSIPAFAWCYDKFCQAQDWVASLGAWQLARRLSVLAQHAIKNYVLEFKTAQNQKRLFLRALSACSRASSRFGFRWHSAAIYASNSARRESASGSPNERLNVIVVN
jgi:hypothetical protein